MTLNDNLSYQEWVDVYKKLIYWELELEKLEDEGMHEILTLQKAEANVQFCKFIEKNYTKWIQNPDSAPTTSPRTSSFRATRAGGRTSMRISSACGGSSSG